MFRIHALLGCPHCDKAAQYLIQKGVPFQFIVADPITLEGVKALTGEQRFPLIVCFLPQETVIIKGFNQGELDIAINKYTSALTSTSTPYTATADKQPAGAPPQVDSRAAPQAEGAN